MTMRDAAWRQARARKAGAASREARRAQAEARGERYATKGLAYVAGYRDGYQTAMHWWQRWAKRQTRATEGA